MGNSNIYPFGQGATMPEGYPIANDLTTNSAQQALSAAMGARVAAMLRGKDSIFVAASDATSGEKLAADYLCNGSHDEATIQAAITELYNKKGGTLILSSGTFVIDDFPTYDSSYDGGCYIAINIPSNNNSYGFTIDIIGNGVPFYQEVGSRGTLIQVSDTCYEGLDDNKKYKVFCCSYASSLIDKARLDVSLYGFRIRLPWNQKKITCVDLRSANRVSVELVNLYAFRTGYNGYSNNAAGTNPPPVAVDGCNGLRMTSGSNDGVITRYNYISAAGFREGIQAGGEHAVCINLGGYYNFYTFTFGNYPWQDAFHHPITLINCSDERSVNMPYFAYCGNNHHSDNRGGQQITMIDFNFERYAPQTPGGELGDLATERVPGTFFGEITYTTQRQGANVGDIPFWENGHGERFITRNAAHKLACGTTERNGYAPTYLQRIWDTDLGKEVICVDTANKTWKDAMGNTV